ncbi:MAG: thioredoxin family protein [Sulfurimonas sp.]|uniref:thioredoxin family protein n=1 Tax=Sulfurimonas sp. TaxID=2022749 RepID=UPI00262072F0|nr:thioredoxin family protein [Sulfurimonas sp.]MDD5399653.1 thioredoxin family protein [Sulfurimonas sp.]
MHKIKFLIYIFLLSSTLYGSELGWINDYDAALKQAEKEKKMVYLFIGADTCRWCDRFKDLTLSKKDVINRLKQEYILLYMSRDRHKIPSKFTTQGVPRHYFLKSDGTVIYEDRGSREPDGFLSLLEEVSLKKGD